MAFANLTQLTYEQYRALNSAFSSPPTSSKTGTPDTRITTSLGGWVSDTLMKFTVQNAAGSSSSVSIVDPDNKTITISITDNPGVPGAISYWSIECGANDARSTDWAINFNVMASNRSTGTWVFRKGGTGDPD